MTNFVPNFFLVKKPFLYFEKKTIPKEVFAQDYSRAYEAKLPLK